MHFAEIVYVLCALTSLLAAFLLWRSYRRTGFPLLFWSSVCFVGLTANNIVLFLDTVIYPNLDLAVARTIPAVLGFGALLYGFIWEET
jgi:hypothetical protein